MKGNFVNIQLDWVTKWGMSPTEAYVFGYLHGWLVDQKAMVFTQTQGEMATALGITRRTIIRTLNKLAAMGCIESKRTTTGVIYTCNHVTKWHKADMLYNEESDKLSQCDKVSHGDKKSQPMRQNGTLECDKVAQPTLYNTNNNTGVTPRVPAREGLGISGELLQVWADFYLAKFNTGYTPDWRTQTSDWGDLMSFVRQKMEEHGQPWEAEAAKSFFADLLEAIYRTADEWQRNHFTLRMIVSQFNNLYSKIINGNSINNTDKLPGTNISSEYLARQLAILAE